MWLAMEPPASMTAEAVIDAKVSLLKSVPALRLDPSEVFLGQFASNGEELGYLNDATVPRGSTCATFASVLLHVDNERWRGVPFLFTAGKGMDERVCEVRVRYRPTASNAMLGIPESDTNELVLRIQPDEAIYVRTVAKEPGITAEQARKVAVMDLSYSAQFAGAYVGDAYERMFLNCCRGDQTLFVSSPELSEAWRIFTPLLHAIDTARPQPVIHPFGVLPPGFVSWAAKLRVQINPTWNEYVALHPDVIGAMTRVFHELDAGGSGALDAEAVTKLASRFYDGRVPTAKKVGQIFHCYDADRSGTITLAELIEGAEKLQEAFGRGHEHHEASAHVHV